MHNPTKRVLVQNFGFLTKGSLTIEVDATKIDDTRHLPRSFFPSIRDLYALLAIELSPHLDHPDLLPLGDQRVVIV